MFDMETPGFGSPLQTYWDTTHRMRVSNDREGSSDPTYLGSLGVVDLDLLLSPDVFGLLAFDDKLPLARMLPGSNLCYDYCCRILRLARTGFMMS